MFKISHFGRYLFPLALIVAVGCSAGEEQLPETDLQQIPKHIAELENVTVIPADARPPDTVVLTREQVFESNEEVYMRGMIWDFTIDQQDRVYISSLGMDVSGIYQFETDGSYLTTIGGSGRGPGEFMMASSMDIVDDELYVFDRGLQKFAVYSLPDLSLIKEEKIKRDRIRYDTLAYVMKGEKMYAARGGKMLLRMHSYDHTPETDVRKVLYYRLANDGHFIPEKVLEADRFEMFYRVAPSGRPEYATPMPFTRSSIQAFSSDGLLYHAWTEDFLIKVFDEEGNYLRAIYHPYPKAAFELSEFGGWESRLNLLHDNPDRIPETWPALHAMVLDDRDRLWIFTITESDSTYMGWVVGAEGALLGQFDFPGSRQSRSVFSPPFRVVVRNGYLYHKEADSFQGINRVTRYRIDFMPSLATPDSEM